MRTHLLADGTLDIKQLDAGAWCVPPALPSERFRRLSPWRLHTHRVVGVEKVVEVVRHFPSCKMFWRSTSEALQLLRVGSLEDRDAT